MGEARVEIAIEDLRDEHLPDVARLAGEFGYPSTLEEVRQRFEILRCEPREKILVASIAGVGVVGWVHVHRLINLTNPPRAEVMGLVVDQRYRSRGIGALLMQSVEEWSRKQGISPVRLYSNAQRADAHRFYRRLGYETLKTSYAFFKDV